MTDNNRKETREGRPMTSRKASPTAGQAGSPMERNRSASAPVFLADAPRQARTDEAWSRFAVELARALRGLAEDEWLVLSLKRRNRFVQVMNQGGAGFRAEAVSDFSLADTDHLSEHDRGRCWSWAGRHRPIFPISSVTGRTARPTTSSISRTPCHSTSWRSWR